MAQSIQPPIDTLTVSPPNADNTDGAVLATDSAAGASSDVSTVSIDTSARIDSNSSDIDSDSDDFDELFGVAADTLKTRETSLSNISREYKYGRQVKLAVVMMIFIVAALASAQSWNPR